jgi:hypothetical protein
LILSKLQAGAIAPCDVKLDPQNTGMGPEKTSFFQVSIIGGPIYLIFITFRRCKFRPRFLVVPSKSWMTFIWSRLERRSELRRLLCWTWVFIGFIC